MNLPVKRQGVLVLVSAPTSTSFALTVQSGGYVHVTRTIAVEPNAATVRLPILPPSASGLGAACQSGPYPVGLGPPKVRCTLPRGGAFGEVMGGFESLRQTVRWRVRGKLGEL